MTIPPVIISELIFHVSNLRFMEKEYTLHPNFDNRSDMIKCQTKVDDILAQYGWDGFMNKKTILESLMDDNKLKQAV